MRPILLATDGSPSSQAATRSAIKLAKATGWPLALVSVATLPTATLAFTALGDLPELEEAERHRAENALGSAAHAAEEAGVAPVKLLRTGDAVEQICDAAAETNAALIVIGARGWSAIRHLVFGSVSSAVLQAARCPVMVVRGELSRLDEDLGAAERTTVRT